jgi:hypothetical protein
VNPEHLYGQCLGLLSRLHQHCKKLTTHIHARHFHKLSHDQRAPKNMSVVSVFETRSWIELRDALAHGFGAVICLQSCKRRLAMVCHLILCRSDIPDLHVLSV